MGLGITTFSPFHPFRDEIIKSFIVDGDSLIVLHLKKDSRDLIKIFVSQQYERLK